MDRLGGEASLGEGFGGGGIAELGEGAGLSLVRLTGSRNAGVEECESKVAGPSGEGDDGSVVSGSMATGRVGGAISDRGWTGER